jgi:hypothetical protein
VSQIFQRGFSKTSQKKRRNGDLGLKKKILPCHYKFNDVSEKKKREREKERERIVQIS